MSEVRRLLAELVAARSPSREEGPAVDVIERFCGGGLREDRNFAAIRGSGAPVLLVCSHLDTVPATAAWTRDPWTPTVEDGRMYGLGANDAKASVAAMALACRDARIGRGTLVFAAVCEEEVGRGGLEAFLPSLPAPDAAIIGEPTGLDIATSQSGLLVLDCVVRGRAGHAARPRMADNPIPRMARDILALDRLDLANGDEPATTLAVTVCAAGDRHNVIPAEARYTVDIRSTPGWSHDALAARIRGAVSGEVAVRSERFRPVATPPGAGVLAAARRARPGARTFASPTLSDWAHLSCPAIKWGPGMSEVSHTADEWVELATVDEAVGAYRRAIEAVLA